MEHTNKHNLSKSIDLLSSKIDSSLTTSENSFYSPMSIILALAMLHEGSDHALKTNFENILRFNPNEAHRHAEVKDFFQLLTPEAEKEYDEDFTLNLVNSLWRNPSAQFKDKFLNILTTNYKAYSEQVEFGNPDAAAKINDWISENTKKMITKVVEPDNFDSLTVLVLVNAIYFKADWLVPFKKERTHMDRFYYKNPKMKEFKETHFMQNQLYAPWIQFTDRIMVELEYDGENPTVSMIIMKPVNSTLEKFWETQRGSASDLVNSFLEIVEPIKNFKKVNLKIPKFKFGGSLKMVPILKDMGFENMFTGGNGEFLNMSEDPTLYLSNVFHQGVIEVNEKGTEAAAVTIAVMKSRGMCMPEPTEDIIFDEPFSFWIVEKTSRSVLFSGRIYDPEF